MINGPTRKFASWVREDRVAIITLDNPPRNQMNKALRAEFIACTRELAEDKLTKVIIVTGAGTESFSAGADIKELPERLAPGGDDNVKPWHYGLARFELTPKPTIAAINGWCLGGGCEIALACDIRIAASNAQLGCTEARLGRFAGGGGTYRLTELVGPAKAKELNFTANPITAEEAFRIGLVNQVVPEGQSLAVAKEMAALIATRPAQALRAIKVSIQLDVEEKRQRQIALSTELGKELSKTEDVREGIEAFIAKRKPVFKDR